MMPRGTGRTSRMLRNAIILAMLGKKVLLLFDTMKSAEMHRKWHLRSLQRIFGRYGLELPKEAIVFRSEKSDLRDLRDYPLGWICLHDTVGEEF